MTAAAFQATYSDWRIIKGRKVVQVVFELPIEKADEAYQVLGGMPIAANETWCGIARLDLSQRRSPEVAETKPRPVPPEPVGADRTKRAFNELPPAQQAGMLCNEQAFRVFLKEKHPQTWRDCDPGLNGSPFANDQAASVVRELCKVNSRSELNGNNNTEWTSLVLAYRLWQNEPSVVPA